MDPPLLELSKSGLPKRSRPKSRPRSDLPAILRRVLDLLEEGVPRISSTAAALAEGSLDGFGIVLSGNKTLVVESSSSWASLGGMYFRFLDGVFAGVGNDSAPFDCCEVSWGANGFFIS